MVEDRRESRPGAAFSRTGRGAWRSP
jgi:hypothetical protein